MKTFVSRTGQLALPAALRARDGIIAGQRFELARLEKGRYLLTRQAASENEGVVDWLLSCPVKGWFVDIES